MTATPSIYHAFIKRFYQIRDDYYYQHARWPRFRFIFSMPAWHEYIQCCKVLQCQDDPSYDGTISGGGGVDLVSSKTPFFIIQIL